MPTLIPRNQAESNVLTYRAMEEPLRRAFKRYADMTAKGMLTKISNILSIAGYDGSNPMVLNRPVDPKTVTMLEEIAARAPAKDRRMMLSKLYGQIGNGSLTVRKAIRDVTEFGIYENTIDLYNAGRRPLYDVTREGILRGEFMVQKEVGISWQMRNPGINQVDAFLKRRWAMSTVTEFMRPLGKAVEDEVAKGLLLGESNKKIAKRIQNIEQMDDVRANRNARTITTAVANEAHMDAYKRHGVKRYEFVATFDERTCPVCGALDGKLFPILEKTVGKNYPPIHPNCRCTTVAALSKELKKKLYDNYEVHLKDGSVKRMDRGTTFEEWERMQNL